MRSFGVLFCMSDALSIEYTPARGSRRKVEFIPRHPGDGFLRVTYEWTGCAWRETGTEPVADMVAVDTAEVLD